MVEDFDDMESDEERKAWEAYKSKHNLFRGLDPDNIKRLDNFRKRAEERALKATPYSIRIDSTGFVMGFSEDHSVVETLCRLTPDEVIRYRVS